MIQTSFFPQPEKDEPIKIIQINPSGFQPRKVEELLPDHDIISDTYMIYPEGGYHPFYGVPNTFPRYQLPIWPYVKRIKFSPKYISEKSQNISRGTNLRKNTTLSQLNPYLKDDYFYINLNLNKRVLRNEYTYIKKNGENLKRWKYQSIAVPMHRLVSLSWHPNPENKPIVMHINDDTTNYLFENLKWGTPGENSKGNMLRRPDTMEHKYLNCVLKGYVKG
tara:strand:+ start:21 stop:683 length:663 start_codon:yes stop_codon:yes gene_type:complete